MFELKLDGIKEATEKLEKMREKMVYEAKFAMLKGADEIVENTRPITPVDTGNLQSSYDYHVNIDSSDKLEMTVGTDVHYAPYVEFGTYKQRSQPHFTPAVINGIPYAIELVSKAIERESEKK